jgi:hypothetical protein
VERSDLAKRFFIAGWERGEGRGERREGRGERLKYPSVRFSMI